MNLISNKDEIKKLQGVLQEISDAMLQISSHQEHIKSIKATVLGEYKDKITPKQLNKLVKVYFKENYEQEVEEHQEFEYLYETIVKGKSENE